MSRSSAASRPGFNQTGLDRRAFIRSAALLAMSASLSPFSSGAQNSVEMPFENGHRPLVKYPQKRPLILLTSRPPQLETPFAVFNEGVTTPNDAFFVRYHLAQFYPEKIDPETFRLEIKGNLKTPASLSLTDLKSKFEPVETTAVLQCSGNSRGFFQPRVPGGQSGNGDMGNARWKGVRLRDVLHAAALGPGARQAVFNGLDRPVIEKTPDFIKALDLDLIMEGDVLLAWEMNGEDLPVLNGYPLRLIVPGYYGTYWIKHLNEITIVNEPFDGFWMTTAYRIPANECACVPVGTTPLKTVPINRLNVRSFITSPASGARFQRGETISLRGIAFDGGDGIGQVLLSHDGGANWRAAALGRDLGRFSFREWTASFKFDQPGAREIKVRAVNRAGQTQPMEPLWNPSGYMRNVVESIRVLVS
jgi:sulfite dehydrogenase